MAPMTGGPGFICTVCSNPLGIGREEPAACSETTFSEIVPATLPVCTANWEAVKVACVALAGMVNVAVRPPVENCMEGSSSGFGPPGANDRLTVPVIGTGNGFDNVMFTGGCCSGCMEPENPFMEMAGTSGRPTTMLCTRVAVVFAASLTWTVKLKVPGVPAVPLIEPEAAFRERPSGKAP